MLLSDTDIERLLSPSSREGFDDLTQVGNWQDSYIKLLIFPFRDSLLTPVGYDLTVGNRCLSLARKEKFTLGPDEQLVIRPGETVLISTAEYLGLPKNRSVAGLIESKVSLVSRGLAHISTTLDHDWEGHLLVSVTNQQSYPITLHRGQPFCTVMFCLSESPATRCCGKPPGRQDIIEESLDQWLKEARQAEPTLVKEILLGLMPLAIVILSGAIGLWLFGPTEGFSGSVALGAALAVSSPSAAKLISRRIRRK